LVSNPGGNFMKNFLILGCIAALFISCGTIADDPNATPMEAYSGYLSWQKVNSATITGDSTGVLGSAHAGEAGFREVYVNATGAAVSAGSAPLPYPEGSIIVKESFKNSGGSKGALTSVTVMTKRSEGYDPENGDWEYGMLSSKMKLQAQGKLSACISCHLAADNDFVFTDNR
jgi:hypothetical protein